jgi:16S rRNA (guanine527-N7)-methyltransferase
MTSGLVPDLSDSLDSGLADLGLQLTGSQTKSLLAYLELLQKWNKVYNLTALRLPQEMLTHHLLDSLAVIQPLRRMLTESPELSGGRVRLMDVGSGAGLPGVVIAICCPEIEVTCVDAVGKKVAFIQQAALALALSNLKGLHARVETVSQTFEVICSRAFSSLSDFVGGSMPALAPKGVWMAMKGKFPQDELSVLPAEVRMFHVEQLTVPGLDAERCLVWMRRSAWLGMARGGGAG